MNRFIKINELSDKDIDKKISFSIAIQFLLQVVNYFLKEMLNINEPHTRQLLSFIFMLFASVFYIKNLHFVMKRNLSFLLKVFYILNLIFLFSILINQEIIPYIVNKAFWTIFVCFPVFAFTYSIRDYRYLYIYLKQESYIIIFLVSMVFLTLYLRKSISYDMTLSYFLLIPIMILINELIIKYNTKNLIFSGFGIIVLVLIGSRGPLLCLGAFLFISILFNIQKVSIVKRMIIIVCLFILMICIFSQEIIQSISNFLLKLGIYSRTFSLFINKNITSLTGREFVYQKSLEMIYNNPIFGYGVAAEAKYFEGFPHNIILELCINFGVIVGLFIIVYIGYSFIKSVFITCSYKRYLSIIFFSCGFISLLVSSSYLEKQEFWIFLAIAMSTQHLRLRKVRQK